MSNPVVTSFAVQLEFLRNSISGNLGWPSPDTGFAAFSLERLRLSKDFSFFSSFSPVVNNSKRLEEAPILAAAGFIFSDLDENTQLQWINSLERLTHREVFPNDRASFFYRPVELLGIAYGASKYPGLSGAMHNWFQKVFQAGERKLSDADFWAFHLAAYSASLYSIGWKARSPQNLSDLTLEDLALYSWFNAAVPLFAVSFGLQNQQKEISSELLNRSLSEGVLSRDISRQVIIYCALRRTIERILQSEHDLNWQVGKDTKSAVEIVKQLCNRFHFAAQQLLLRRSGRQPLKMEDEYDVQYLMHSLLKLHFDDVRPEEWCPSYAGRSSRIDFLLKKEKIIIETKMTRKGLDDKKVGEELTLDKAKYRTFPDCETLVCFVYDPNGSCKNPTALENDLSERSEKFQTIVIVNPKAG